MKSVYVKYQVSESFADANAENIRKVMSAVREMGSEGIRYQSFRQSDGVTFVHFGMYEDDQAIERLSSLPAFKAFQAALKESKPTQPPTAEWLDLVGASYDIL